MIQLSAPHAAPGAWDETAMLQALKSFPGLRSLAPEYLIGIGAQSLAVRFEPGEIVQPAGRPFEQIVLVLAGEVVCTVGGRVTEVVTRDGLVGGPAALGDGHARFEAKAARTTDALVISAAAARTLIADNITVYATVLEDLARTVLHLRQRCGPGKGHRERPREGIGGRPPTMVDKMAVLADTLPLRRVPIDVIGTLAAVARSQAVPRSSTVWRAGDLVDEIVLVMTGTLSLDYPDARVRVGGGEALGWDAMIARTPVATTLTATDDTHALRLSRAVILDELEDDPDAAKAVLLELANQAAGLRAYADLRRTWETSEETPP